MLTSHGVGRYPRSQERRGGRMRMTGRMVVAGAAVMAVLGVSNGRVAGGPPEKGIELRALGWSTALDEDGKVSFDKAAVEISAFDPVTARAFVTFGEAPRVDIIDLSDPTDPQLFDTIDLTPWGTDAHSTSVAVREASWPWPSRRGRTTPIRGKLRSSHRRRADHRGHGGGAARHADLHAQRRLPAGRQRGPAQRRLRFRPGGQASA